MTGLTAVCTIFWEEALESLAAKPFIHCTYQLIVSIFFFTVLTDDMLGDLFAIHRVINPVTDDEVNDRSAACQRGMSSNPRNLA